MICKKCGKLYDDSSRFCPYCGQKAEEQISAGTQTNIPPNAYYAGGTSYPGYPGYNGNVNPQEKKQKKNIVPIVIAAVAVAAVMAVVLSCVGFLFLSRTRDDIETDGSAESSFADLMKPEDSTDMSLADLMGSGSEAAGQESVNDASAVNEVLGYVDQASEVVSRAYSEIQVLQEDESLEVVERYSKQAALLEDSYSELLDLQRQAIAVGGIDANFANAAKVYFDMACDSQKAFCEIWVFLADYLEFCDEFLDSRPQIEYYDSLSSYYNDLYSWYQTTKAEYSAIDSCPSCLETKWKQYGDVLDLNESIAYKLYDADRYADWLRAYSAGNMSDRYDTVEYNQYLEFLDCLVGEKDHFQKQQSVAATLAEEMHSYAEMGEAERDGFEFDVSVGKIWVDYEAIDTIYPSLYNTYDAFLIVKTGCVNGTRKIVVEAEIPGLTQKYKESFTLDPAYTEIYIKPPALAGDLDLNSAKNAQISVTISEQDGTLIDAKTFPVTIKSKYDVEWYSDEYGVATKDNILCFLTPESSAIAELKRLAIDEMSGMTSGTVESFAGYQNVTSWSNYVYTYLQAAGIMRAMYETGIRYNMDPFSISGSNQHVLFPEDVISQKSGLCIETSLVVASALQSAGMHVFLVLPPGHAQVAVETWSGSGQYFLIETTALSSGNNSRQVYIDIGNQLINEGTMASSGSPIMYLTSEQWDAYLSVEGTYLIDCDDSRILGLTPFTN